MKKKSLADEEGGNPLVKKKKRAAYLSHYDLMENIIDRLLEEAETKDGHDSFIQKSCLIAKNGMKLHASGIQSPEAKAAWSKMGYGHKSGRRFVKL
jgi:hypothetical protein